MIPTVQKIRRGSSVGRAKDGFKALLYPPITPANYFRGDTLTATENATEEKERSVVL